MISFMDFKITILKATAHMLARCPVSDNLDPPPPFQSLPQRIKETRYVSHGIAARK
jgi:hypothetical protein